MTSKRFSNALGQGCQTELLMNPAWQPGAPYSSTQQEVLSDAAFARACETITRWPGYAQTPLVALDTMARDAGLAAIRYKDEGSRFGLGSFKALGGAYAVLRLLTREIAARKSIAEPSVAEILAGDHADVVSQITVCCATDGNHGRSVAWGAQTFGCGCVIFIHATVSEGRRRAIEAYGAEVRRTAGNYDDSVREADATARAQGWFVVSDTSYPGYREIPKDVMQGYEMMAHEAAEQLEAEGLAPPSHIFMQTGVGGAAAAVAAYFYRRYGPERAPAVVLADPLQSACWMESLRVGTPTAIEGDLDTLMAGLACGEVSLLAWDVLQPMTQAVVSVEDRDAVEIMRRLAHPRGQDPLIVAGESAVAGLAACLAVAAEPAAAAEVGLGATSCVLVFGTEGDTDPELYETLVGQSAKALRNAAEGAA